MRIILRHGSKLYDNSETCDYRHDPGITEDGKLNAQMMALSLLEWTRNFPYMIVCSPYRRARETASEMAYLVNTKLREMGVTGMGVPVVCDASLSEYLGNHHMDALDVYPDTLIYSPPHPESYHQMTARVRCHNDRMREIDSSQKVVWYITHGIIINRLASAMGIVSQEDKYDLKRIGYLSGIAWQQVGKKLNTFFLESNPFSVRESSRILN